MSNKNSRARRSKQRAVRAREDGNVAMHPEQQREQRKLIQPIEQTSPLLKMPAEIMTNIMSYLKPKSLITYYLHGQQPPYGRLIVKGPSRNLRLVCRQMNDYICDIRKESGWNLNICLFLDQPLHLIRLFAHKRISSKLNRITHLTLRGLTSHTQPGSLTLYNTFLDQWVYLTKSLPKLRRLNLEFEEDRLITSDPFYDRCWFAHQSRRFLDNEYEHETQDDESIESMDVFHLAASVNALEMTDADELGWRHFYGNCRERFEKGKHDTEYRLTFRDDAAIEELPRLLEKVGNLGCTVRVKYKYNLIQFQRSFRVSMHEYDWIDFKVTTAGFEAVERYLGPWHERYCPHVHTAEEKEEWARQAERVANMSGGWGPVCGGEIGVGW